MRKQKGLDVASAQPSRNFCPPWTPDADGTAQRDRRLIVMPLHPTVALGQAPQTGAGPLMLSG